MEGNNNQRVLEALQMQPLSDEEKNDRHILGRLYGPIATCTESTRNGRLYNKQLWENALNDEVFKEKVDNKSLFLELGHPADREETDMLQACACIPEMPKIVDNDLYAYVDILDTPNGRLLKTLVDYGFTPGISSRGSGDLMADNSVDPETFFLETWDIVQLPAVKKARLNVCESFDRDNVKMKKALQESFKKATEEEREPMKEALDNLNIKLDEGILDKLKGKRSLNQTMKAIADLNYKDPNIDSQLKELTTELDNHVQGYEATLNKHLAKSQAKLDKVAGIVDKFEKQNSELQDIFNSVFETSDEEINKILDEMNLKEGILDKTKTKVVNKLKGVKTLDYNEALKYILTSNNNVLELTNKFMTDSKRLSDETRKLIVDLNNNKDESQRILLAKQIKNNLIMINHITNNIKLCNKKQALYDKAYANRKNEELLKKFIYEDSGHQLELYIDKAKNENLDNVTEDEVNMEIKKENLKESILKEEAPVDPEQDTIYDEPAPEDLLMEAADEEETEEDIEIDVDNIDFDDDADEAEVEEDDEDTDEEETEDHPEDEAEEGTVVSVKEFKDSLEDYDDDMLISFSPITIGEDSYKITEIVFNDPDEDGNIQLDLGYVITDEEVDPADELVALDDDEEVIDEVEDEESAEDLGDEEPEAEDDDEDEVMESLKEALRKIKALEYQNKVLKEQLSVRNSKDEKLHEELKKYKNAFRRTSQLAEQSVELEEKNKDLNEQLTNAKREVRNAKSQTRLNEGLEKERSNSKRLAEQLSSAQKELTAATTKYEEQINDYKQKIVERTNLAKQYKAKYQSVVESYVESKASMLGVRPSEIRNRLNENYSIQDVDDACDRLMESSLNMNRLPFERKQKVTARLNESVDPVVQNNNRDGYDIDDSLLELAGLSRGF